MDVNNIILYFYPEDTPLRNLLLKHSIQVRDKALEIAKECPEVKLDMQLVSDGAMLHDIGIVRCHAPSILCNGSENYIAHGTIGADMLREYGKTNGIDLEACARICERHTGAGLTAKEIREQQLPIPAHDYLPETNEEKLICLADKFFSKSSPEREKSLEWVRHSLAKFGSDTTERLESMLKLFKITGE